MPMLSCLLCGSKLEFESQKEAERTFEDWQEQLQKISRKMHWKFDDIMNLLETEVSDLAMASNKTSDEHKIEKYRADMALIKNALESLQKTSFYSNDK
jgi:hypothetical protein